MNDPVYCREETESLRLYGHPSIFEGRRENDRNSLGMHTRGLENMKNNLHL